MSRMTLAIVVLLALTPDCLAGVCATPYVPYYPTNSYGWERAGYWRGRYYPAGWYAYDSYYNAYRRYGYSGLYYGEYYAPTVVIREKVNVIPVAAFYPTPVYFATSTASGVVSGLPTQGYGAAGGAASGYGGSAAPSAVPRPVSSAPPPPASKDNTDLILTAISKLGNRLDSRMDVFERRLEVVEKKNGVKPAPARQEDVPPPEPGEESNTPPAAPATGWGVLQTSCLACHQEGKIPQVKNEAGKLVDITSFVMFTAKGERALITKKQQEKILSKTHAGEMPPQPNFKNIAPLKEGDYVLVKADMPNWKLRKEEE